MQKLFQRYREQQQQSLESHASTRIKDVLKEIQKEEEFGDEEEEDVLEAILLDHVAFRTFKGLHHDGDEKHHQFVNVKQMLMEKLRYRESGETLVFPKKKLKATWLKPPTPLMPRVFLSEIDIEAFEDERMSAIVRKAISSREEEKEKARSWRMIFGSKNGTGFLCVRTYRRTITSTSPRRANMQLGC